MSNEVNSVNTKVKIGFFKIIRNLWPNFLVYLPYAFTISALFINSVIISDIIWPGDDLTLHAEGIGILVGTSTYMLAVSGILFGFLADKYSRTRLFGFTELIYGFGLILNGFVPGGRGFTTFIFFLVFSLIRGFGAGGYYPIIASYVNDSTEEQERSQFFGIMQALFQVFQIIGMVFSSILFENYFWRLYFFVLGGIITIFGILMFYFAKEPKRGAKRKELKDLLSDDKIIYDYQLTKETLKTTIFSATNIIAFFEGIFTSVIVGVPDFLITIYLQAEPHNLSPLILSLFLIIFGLPGGVIGSLAFAKISDRLGKRNIKNRVYIIVFSMVIIFFCFMIFFFIPLPNITPEQGRNMLFVVSLPAFWILGLIAFFVRSVLGLYNINQPPILQEINLPEAQGKISSANQFLESIGSGTGPIIAGSVLLFFNQNYQITAFIIVTLGIIGGLLWLFALKWINKDADRISSILKVREQELKKRSEKNS
jgi:MFS family permease